jgi:serine/threonine protein kinase
MFQPFSNMRKRNQADNIDFSKVKLEDFDMLEILGTGTFGKVRLCKHRSTNIYFCMKILSKVRVVRLKQADHINNEKNVLNMVQHPFIVKLFSTFKDATNLYLLLEFVPGGELFNYIRRAGRLPNHITRLYAAEIVMAIEHLHQNNILYRDLKPENLLLDEFGHIKLTDFGFSKYVPVRTYSMCGTPEYIAPEIILNKGHDRGVDWWSLGVLIYEMLAGYPPFNGDPNKTIFEKILSGKVEMPEKRFEPDAEDIILKLLMVDPATRLGCMKNGVLDIKNHAWFRSIEWDQLVQTPFPGLLNPGITKDNDTHNFYKYSDVDVHEDLDQNVDYEKVFAEF